MIIDLSDFKDIDHLRNSVWYFADINFDFISFKFEFIIKYLQKNQARSKNVLDDFALDFIIL